MPALCRAPDALSWQPVGDLVETLFLRRTASHFAGKCFRADCLAASHMGQGCMSAPPEEPTWQLGAFVAGFNATWTSVFCYVLFGTYVGIGALAHDFGFSVGWALP